MNLSDATMRVSLARAAQPAWGAMSISKRCEFLGHMRREVATNCESMALAIARETGKHELDTLSGDVLVTLEHIRYYEFNAHSVLRRRKRAKPLFFFQGCRFETSYEPHGVVLIFGPSNYPLQLSFIPLITALVAGNAVILKCSEQAPRTAALMAQICANAGLPTNLVQVCSDNPDHASALIDAKPDFIFFTGSTKNGRQIAQGAAAHLIPGIFELGGKDSSIVFADCHMERAIEGITYGAFSNAGRVCVAAKRAYIEASIYTDFVERLTRRVSQLRIGRGAASDFPPYPAEGQTQLRLQIDDALSLGAKLLWPEHAGQISQKPVILAEVSPNAMLLREESFGPVLCVAPFKDEREALSLANSGPFALGSSIWTRDRTRARRLAGQLNAGSCAVNDVIRVIANPYVPFGGNGQSGYGRYHGEEGLRAFSRVKTIMMTNSHRTREINWFPFEDRTLSRLARLLRFRHGSTGLISRLIQMIPLIMLAVAFPLGISAQSTSNTQLSIGANLTPNARGELGYLVFVSSTGFPGDPGKAVRHGFVPIPSGAKQMTVKLDISPGTYAVSLYEDLNRNHKLDHNLLGVPREPVGVSNNPVAHFGPPRFGESSFHMDSRPQTITIRMVQP